MSYEEYKSWYIIISFAFTFWACLQIPTAVHTGNNIIGSFLIGMFGFILWPVLLYAVIKVKRTTKVTSHVEVK